MPTVGGDGVGRIWADLNQLAHRSEGTWPGLLDSPDRTHRERARAPEVVPSPIIQ